MSLIGITMGDPAGVGPEIIMKALALKDVYEHQYVVYGAVDILEHYNDMLGLGCRIVEIQDPEEYEEGAVNVIDSCGLVMKDYEIGQLSAKCGDAAYKYIERSIKDAMNGKIAAVVTAPLNKEALHMGGHLYDGHTEIFATLTGTKTYAMMFYGPLKIMHVSTHCCLLNQAVIQTGSERPHIAVAGLNPHAGEHGLFGDEEIQEITPAIEETKQEGIYVEGPIPPDTVFSKTLNGVYDAAVAMYHDQGHIAAKLQLMSQCVNCTIGLPIIRTSVDHGTAFDIAGKGVADGENMKQAMLVAEEFMKNR